MTLDTTVAGASAKSYLSVADADALAADDLGPEAESWLAAVTDAKEKALKRATREIDAYLRSGWTPYVATQALLFPRAVDYAGTPAAPVIPTSVKRACYEQATFVLRNASVLDNAQTRKARDVQSASEPNISFSEKTSGDVPQLADAALMYLDGFRRSGGDRGLRSMRVSSPYSSGYSS
ncbi:MAG: putative DnaT-like ssDNA binding protein [Chloroflexota bacterium]|nr:putative DnaT-like ssDNA binding protein [Chloroflexota bacterium]